MESGTRDFSQLLNRRCQRKDVRRERKRLKKTARIAYAVRKPVEIPHIFENDWIGIFPPPFHGCPINFEIDKVIAEAAANAESSSKKRKKRKKSRRKGKKDGSLAGTDSSQLPSTGATNELEAFKVQVLRICCYQGETSNMNQ